MTITASQVAELRKATDCGMMDCKKALLEANGDAQSAIEILRKKGIAKATSKMGRITAEGMISIKIDKDQHCAVMIEINCETDFVTRDVHFQQFIDKVSTIALEHRIKTIDQLSSFNIEEGKTVNQWRQDLIMKIGENISLRRLSLMETTHILGTYIHGKRIGVLIELKGGDYALAKDIAMHVAASKPQVVSPEQVDPETLNKEREIYREQVKDSGKKEAILEQMINGKIKKFLSEVSLTQQPFVKNLEISVQQLLTDHTAQVLQFERFELGEGIVKKTCDFAQEVAAQLKEGQ